MGDSFKRGSFYGGLSQLKYYWTSFSLFSKKGFSGLALLVFSVTGVVPGPALDTPESSDSSEAASLLRSEEVCRWQEDFSFFNDLSGEKRVAAAEVPCSDLVEQRVSQVAIGSPSDTVNDTVLLSEPDETLKGFIETMVAGYPLATMAPAIAEYDREVAALIVGIAKKESNWGKRVPVDASGADCFNYWGWKGAGSRGIAMGHGCFGSPEEAVQAVGKRITELVEKRQTSEPKNMIVWKCGSSCATHSPESVRKWIADVDIYYRQIVKN